MTLSKVFNMKTFYDCGDLENMVKVQLMTDRQMERRMDGRMSDVMLCGELC